MEQIKNLTRSDKIKRLDSYNFSLSSKAECIDYVSKLMLNAKSDKESRMLHSILYYLRELNGQFLLEPWCILHDGGEYPYVGQKVCCYNSIGDETIMIYNPDGDPDYDWKYNDLTILAWCPYPLDDSE